jgi:hypothetical protein
VINEPNGEREQGYVSIWRTATGLRQWSVKVTEGSSRDALSAALQLAREIDRRLMRSRPKPKAADPTAGHTVKVRERVDREVGSRRKGDAG